MIDFIFFQGNCVVLKPSELSANVSDLLVELVPKYLDPETIRVAAGPIQIGITLNLARFFDLG